MDPIADLPTLAALGSEAIFQGFLDDQQRFLRLTRRGLEVDALVAGEAEASVVLDFSPNDSSLRLHPERHRRQPA